MTDEDVIARVAALFGRRYTLFRPKQSHWNVSYKLTLKGSVAVEMMK
jgi:hypothetical protein